MNSNFAFNLLLFTNSNTYDDKESRLNVFVLCATPHFTGISPSYTSLKENMMPRLQHDSSVLKLCKSRRRRRCTVSAVPLRVWLSINKSRQTQARPALQSLTSEDGWTLDRFDCSATQAAGSLRKACQWHSTPWAVRWLAKAYHTPHKSHSDKGLAAEAISWTRHSKHKHSWLTESH